jgi:hypothetical protein
MHGRDTRAQITKDCYRRIMTIRLELATEWGLGEDGTSLTFKTERTDCSRCRRVRQSLSPMLSFAASMPVRSQAQLK